MIKLLNIEMKNFLSYEKESLSFLGNRLSLIDGYNYDENDSNGAGKSSFVSAISYAIYGDVPREIKIDEVVRRGQKKCVVSLDFEEDGVSYRIERGRKPNFVKFSVNGNDVSEDPQSAIDRIIGLSLKTFYRCICFPQKSDTNYLISNDRDKKEIFTNILDELSIFDLVSKKIKIDMKDATNSLSLIESELFNLKRNLTETVSNIDYYDGKYKGFEEDRLDKKESMLLSIRGFEDSNVELKNKIEYCLSRVVDVDTSMIDIINGKIKELDGVKRIKDDSVAKISEVLNKIENNKSRIRRIDREIEEMKSGVCPTCNQKVVKDNAKETTEKYLLEIVSLNKENDGYMVEETKLRKVLDRTENILCTERSLFDEKNKIMILVEKNNTINNVEVPNIKLMIKQNIESINDVGKKIKLLMSEKNGYGETLNKTKNDKIIIDAKIEEFNRKLVIEDENLSDLKILDDAFGKNGIKSYVFASIVSELNDSIQSYLGKMFNRNITLCFDTEKKRTSGEIVQEFKTVIRMNGDEISYGSLSGGEQRRAILAVDLALADIISKRSKKSFNVKFFDESFNELSSSGKETTMYMLKELSKDLDMLGVIDHSTEFRGIFDKVIKVELRDGISRISDS